MTTRSTVLIGSSGFTEAIKQVAEMLDEHGSLSCEEIDAVLSKTCGGSYPG